MYEDQREELHIDHPSAYRDDAGLWVVYDVGVDFARVPCVEYHAILL